MLTPFRTWQNTMTGEEAAELTELFGFNIPQRWSIAHLWHAIRTGEAHVGKLAHITTLAGYFHYMLTGVNAVGIGEASGMFPIDSETLDYDRGMMEKFDRPYRGAALHAARSAAAGPARRCPGRQADRRRCGPPRWHAVRRASCLPRPRATPVPA